MKIKKIIILILLMFSSFTFSSCNNGEPSNQTFTVTYYLNDGTETIYKQVEATVNETVTHPENPSRIGYDFKGWYVDSICLVEFPKTTKITSNTSLYAKWYVSLTSSSSSSSTTSNSSSSIPDENSITYTIDSLPDWITNDDCGIFAWVWSNTNPGEWIETTYDNTDSTNIKVTFTVDEEITGMLLVRTVAGTVTPDWEQSDNQPGEIYNQTEDITIVAGQTTYSCSSWKEYSPN